MNGSADVEINGYRVQKDIGLIFCEEQSLSNSTYTVGSPDTTCLSILHARVGQLEEYIDYRGWFVGADLFFNVLFR